MDDTEVGKVRRTTAAGMVATWHVNDHTARIQSVHEQGGRLLMSYSPDYPDLDQAQDLWPRQKALWDAVRHELANAVRNET